MSVDNEVAKLSLGDSQLALNLVIIAVGVFEKNFMVFETQKREKFSWFDWHVSTSIRALDLNNTVGINQPIRSSCKEGVSRVNKKAAVHDI